MQTKPKSSSAQKQISQSLDQTDRPPEPHTLHPSTKIHPKKAKITLGICAMKKKVESKPMREILHRLKCHQIQIIEMYDCLERDWSTWPIVDSLICFYSDGFPYLMAWRYVNKHQPFLINNLQKQQLLWDRTVVYDILNRLKVPVAKHYFSYRDENHVKNIEDKCFGRCYTEECMEKVGNVPTLATNSSSSGSGMAKLKTRITMPDSIDRQLGDKINSFIESIATINNEKKIEKQISMQQKQIDSNATNNHNSPHLTSSGSDREKTTYPTMLREYYDKIMCERPNFSVNEIQQDCIELKGGDQSIKLKKPFVEKPFDSQNHEICIYYPLDMGGGRKKLFRKVKNTSSEYDGDENHIRRDGNYIYQQFLPTNAFDIKVYTIGRYYMYAQARKSPTLDGVVKRNKQGKENRFPVMLTNEQKFISSRIVEQFGQEVCGFDLLRANNKSYVCDVNGWSFVKSNPKYWQDCAKILKKKIIGHFFPEMIAQHMHVGHSIKRSLTCFRTPFSAENSNVEELRSIVSIFRHADRSPKLKLKVKTTDPRFIEFLPLNKEEIKIKDNKNMTNFLQVIIQKIAELDQKDSQLKEFMQMKLVLESGGHFQGLMRKLQLKVLERGSQTESGKGPIKKIMIVLKWGGDLTYLGYEDAIELGQKMRMQRYDDNDCLSLYSSYRHDLKTYASDEGRCIKTAAAFLKGFLSIEGELAPIISSMVQTDSKSQTLLDCTSEQNHSVLGDKVCDRLSEIMNKHQDLLTSYLEYTKLEDISQSMLEIIKNIGEPRSKLKQLHKSIKELVDQIERIYMQSEQEQRSNERKSNSIPSEQCENTLLISSRWSKLKKDFYDSEKDKFNISKVPEIYDTIRHDYRKNTPLFNMIDSTIRDTLYKLAKQLAHFVVFNEYGITDDERIQVGTDICLPLLEKILVDLLFWKERSEDQGYWKCKDTEQQDNSRHIRTRLYFTSASHMYSLLNILALGNHRILSKLSPSEDAKKVLNIVYMGYLSHIEFRLYQNLKLESWNPKKFRLEITFSTKYKKTKEMKQFSLGGDGFTINQIQMFIQGFVGKKKDQEERKKSKSKPKSDKNKNK